MTAIALAAEPARPQETIHVECHGKLRTGIVAVGAETTGTTISFDGVTWELQLTEAAQREFAREHDKKSVAVVGSLRQVVGTQIKTRWVVDVEKFSVPEEPQKAGATVTLKGTLQACENKDAETPLMVDAGGIKWPVHLTKNSDLQSQGKQLTGKKVSLKGHVEKLSDGPGSRRTCIHVSSLKAVE